MPQNLMVGNKHFRRPCCLDDGGSMVVWNICIL